MYHTFYHFKASTDGNQSIFETKNLSGNGMPFFLSKEVNEWDKRILVIVLFTCFWLSSIVALVHLLSGPDELMKFSSGTLNPAEKVSILLFAQWQVN